MEGPVLQGPGTAGLGNPRNGQTAYRSGKSVRERSDESYEELLVSDSIEVDPSSPGFAGGDRGSVVLPASPGDNFRFRATVTTEGGVYTQLFLAPTVSGDSTGSAPQKPRRQLSGLGGIRYGDGVYTDWVKGTEITLTVEYQIPSNPSFEFVNMYAGINKPNPDQYANHDWTEDERSGTISWKGAAITRNEPLPSGGGGGGGGLLDTVLPEQQIVSGVSNQTLLLGGAAAGGVLLIAAT